MATAPAAATDFFFKEDSVANVNATNILDKCSVSNCNMTAGIKHGKIVCATAQTFTDANIGSLPAGCIYIPDTSTSSAANALNTALKDKTANYMTVATTSIANDGTVKIETVKQPGCKVGTNFFAIPKSGTSLMPLTPLKTSMTVGDVVNCSQTNTLSYGDSVKATIATTAANPAHKKVATPTQQLTPITSDAYYNVGDVYKFNDVFKKAQVTDAFRTSSS